MRKYIFVVTFLCLCSIITTYTCASSHGYFYDVNETSWYYDEVRTVYESGIMEGKTNAKFDPTANMSRAELVTVLCRMSENEFVGKGEILTFSDTKTDAWYADYVGWGCETEIVKGLPENRFAPNQAVSRQEMAVFIDRFINYKNIDLVDNSKINSFNDSVKIADYAKAAVETMRKSGIITGDQNGYFNPTSNASRAEVATVVTRILPLLDNDIVITPPIVDRGNFDIQKAFLYSEAKWNGLPYRIYLPEDYSPNKEYPITYFIGTSGYGTDNVSQLDDVEIIFNNINSPVFDSIVVVPQSPSPWGPEMASKLGYLVNHINSNYSIDSERKYIIAVSDGVFASWKMMLLFPQKLSACLFVHGIGPTTLTKPDGVILIDSIPSELKDIPIHFLHDIDDGVTTEWSLGPEYGKIAKNALIELGGFTNVKLTETSGHGQEIYKYFVSEDDTSLLEWLFAQRRETK